MRLSQGGSLQADKKKNISKWADKNLDTDIQPYQDTW